LRITFSERKALEILIDFLDEHFILNPYPTFRRLRDRQPIFWHHSLECWIVSRFDECEYILSDTDNFSSDYRKVGIETAPADVTVQSIDPPEHDLVRKTLRSSLRQSVDVADLEFQLDREMAGRLAQRRNEEVFDFVSRISIPVSVSAACSLLGADHSRNPDLYTYAEAMARSMSGELIPETTAAGQSAREKLSQLIADSVAGSGQGGLLGELGSLHGGATSYDLLVNSARVMFLAAINSNQRAASNAVNVLLDDSAAAEMIAYATGPALDRTIHEMLRFDSPVQAHEKVCLGTANLCGQKISYVERVTVLIGSANRDERRFIDPDLLDFDRSPNHHLAFGKGVHTCIGMALARAQLRAVLKNMFSPGAPKFAEDDDVRREINPALRGFATLPLVWT
jgi:cytochrome P450